MAAAPDAKHAFVASPLGNRQGNQFVIGRAIDSRLDTKVFGSTGTHQDIRSWFAGEQIVRDADRMLRARGDNLIDVSTKDST